MAVKIRRFQREDVAPILELANAYAPFDGMTSEADLAISFANGMWVAEDDGRLVGLVYGYFKEVPSGVLEKRGAKVGYAALMAVSPDCSTGRDAPSRLLARLLIYGVPRKNEESRIGVPSCARALHPSD